MPMPSRREAEEGEEGDETAQKMPRKEVEEREEGEKTRKKDQRVWESGYSPKYIHSQNASHLEKKGSVAVESDDGRRRKRPR